MRLIDTTTGEFRSFNGTLDVPYAILSHTWFLDGEQSYQDILAIQESFRAQRNLSDACARAREDGYELLWVDSCCIDKSSSAELSEAINSMFEWYSRASICYVYLADVDDDDIVDDPHSQFRRARWHNRGWTLQELVAPRYVVFFSRNWRPLGTKSTLSRVIEAVTGVDRAILNQDRPVHSASVARRMSWAAKRETTRVEDQAYSLLGIFGLHLATNYGEGRNAFVRLQEAILRAIPD
ncbi:HET-domain-containing protein [Dichomitus squalens LYAD-421 SS1]|uniref:HET-domain-containing protein n=1 Tax=Dichomitus squalens (strain LYAD-421) TaxID=732165 RepID=UPI00044141B2|nr:HET-domain-containing protein [Dichomitus squalens LYAD-421 SS1]EJF64953.1 HET-domain-containing protein [Dichomitus squalens LYAD-421 SS1]